MPSTLVVFASDQTYFGLARGLALSLLPLDLERQGIGIRFIDLGCDEPSLSWLRRQGISVATLDPSRLGSLGKVGGYERALVCRPFLPELFPDTSAFVWLDADVWVQGQQAVSDLAKWASGNPTRLFICPEWHYSYLNLNLNFAQTHLENLRGHYRALYGEVVAAEMSTRPLYNNGVFAMAASNPLWSAWKAELESLYSRQYAPHEQLARHMAEQLALNVLAFRTRAAVPVDPTYNYLCTWGLPFRDPAGVVRVPLPPARPIDIVHLVNWKQNRALYREHGLLYQRGEYLTAGEQELLFGK